MINPDAIREEYGYSCICQQCRRTFEAQRASALFCGGSCRAKHHRAKQKRQEIINSAKDAVKALIENMPWEGNSQEYVALQDLRTIISRGLASVQEK